ncbi:MAG: hypothetical protein WC302_01950 [Candidatus Paceibacterota bacterium]|jgi:hypothetical protein
MHFQEISQSVLSFLINPPPVGWFLAVKITFIVSTLLLLGGLIFTASRSSYLLWSFFEDASEFFTFRPSGVRKLTKTWQKISFRLESGLESEYKLAVIEADGLLDDVLRRMGFKGETLEERLKGLTFATLPNMEDVKEAHKSRTAILHNPDQPLSLEEAKKLMGTYEKALENIQAF